MGKAVLNDLGIVDIMSVCGLWCASAADLGGKAALAVLVPALEPEEDRLGLVSL